jgi:diguanylate cyclase (GGDEF)-like protein
MKSLSPAHLTANRTLAAASLCAVLAHLALSLLFPQQAWITPVTWITLYALALAVTVHELRHTTPAARWRWRLIGLNFLLAIGSFLCILYGEYLQAAHIAAFCPQAAWLNDFLHALRALPLLLAVCTPEEADRRMHRLLDILQVVLIAVIFLVLFTPGLFTNPVDLAPIQSDLFNRYSYAQSLIITLLSILAVVTAKTADSRHFHRVLAIYLSIGLPVALWTNHFLINTWHVPPASPLFVPSDFCLLAFISAVPLLRTRTGPKEPSRKLVFLRLGAAAFLPLFALLASMILAIAGNHPILGILGGLVSLALFGTRSAYGQYQLLATQWNLQSANQQLEVLSQHDPLTGLYNRRWFGEFFSLEWQRAQRSHQPISLLLIDVDHFKLYNDTLGHAAGDLCLQTVAKLFALQLRRTSDAVARYGGEEFVAMLPNTNQEGAHVVALRMMQALEEVAIPHAASPFHQVTVSIGGATWQTPETGTPAASEMTPETMFLLVDAALYEAKNQGRNQIRMKQPQTPNLIQA